MARRSKKHYRLPDGTTTTDVVKVGELWDAVIKSAESFFPGYKVLGVDPGVQLVKWGENNLGQTIAEDRFTLSLPALRVLEAKLGKFISEQ